MAPPVDLTDLTSAVGKYADQHRIVLAAGPVTAGALVRAFITKNKLVSTVLVGGGSLVAIKEIAGPSLALMHDQFGYLTSLLGH